MMKAITLLTVILLLASIVSANDINSILNEAISLKFRTETFQEYKRLTEDALNLLKNTDSLLLQNPSLIEGNLTGRINTSDTGTKILAVKEAAKGFVSISISKGKPVALISFNDEAAIDSLPSKEKNILNAKIELYRPEGMSCVHCGILKGVEALATITGNKDMVLVTDGHTSISKTLPLEAANFAKDRGIRIYTIALGGDADEAFLRRISELTGGKFYKITCSERLADIQREFSDELGTFALILDTSNSMSESLSISCFEDRKICGPRCIMDAIISILEPVYVTLTLLVGIYLVFISGTPEGRVKAKSSLQLLIISMCIITLSPFLLTLLFGISHGITQLVLSQAPENKGEIFSEGINYILAIGKEYADLEETSTMPFIVYPYLLTQALIILLQIRYFILLALSILFPFAIIFYPLHFTRGIAKLLLEQTALWTFSQVAMAFVFVVVALGINLTYSLQTFVMPAELRIIMEIAALLMLIATPFFMSLKFSGFLK